MVLQKEDKMDFCIKLNIDIHTFNISITLLNNDNNLPKPVYCKLKSTL